MDANNKKPPDEAAPSVLVAVSSSTAERKDWETTPGESPPQLPRGIMANIPVVIHGERTPKTDDAVKPMPRSKRDVAVRRSSRLSKGGITLMEKDPKNNKSLILEGNDALLKQEPVSSSLANPRASKRTSTRPPIMRERSGKKNKTTRTETALVQEYAKEDRKQPPANGMEKAMPLLLSVLQNKSPAVDSGSTVDKQQDNAVRGKANWHESVVNTEDEQDVDMGATVNKTRLQESAANDKRQDDTDVNEEPVGVETELMYTEPMDTELTNKTSDIPEAVIQEECNPLKITHESREERNGSNVMRESLTKDKDTVAETHDEMELARDASSEQSHDALAAPKVFDVSGPTTSSASDAEGRDISPHYLLPDVSDKWSSGNQKVPVMLDGNGTIEPPQLQQFHEFMNNEIPPFEWTRRHHSTGPGQQLQQQQQQPVSMYPFYREETAWKEHNPPMPVQGQDIPDAVASEDLQPLPPAPPLPDFPDTGKCSWSFDEKSRVLLANFVQPNGKVEVTVEDEKFLLHMMERDDITCISDGLAKGINPELYSLETIVDACGDEHFHKFRQFRKDSSVPQKKKSRKGKKKRSQASKTKAAKSAYPSDDEEQRQPVSASQTRQEAESEAIDMEEPAQPVVASRYQEVDQSLSLKIADYAKYVSMRQAALKRLEAGDYETGGDEETEFRFLDHEGTEHVIDVRDTVLYMIDFDVVKLLPDLNEALKKNFKLPGCLPGGIHCMMNVINENGRPFMGPNGYFSLPESFTQVHQDGHGTVDSGHLCLAGYNEVVMLRRMTERHKKHALSLLQGEGKAAYYDGLYDMPHRDNSGEKPDWPLEDAIEACRRMNYYPSVFILKPGQLVHINKGRLHAFRKMSHMSLPSNDCHCTLRSDLLASLETTSPERFLCFSIAWDWMYRGVTSEGICREVTTTLECAMLNRHHKSQSLAIPELALLQTARTKTPAAVNAARNQDLCKLYGSCDQGETEEPGFKPATEDILRGILPGLRYVVDQHTSASQLATSSKNGEGAGVTIADRPNSWENPQTFSLDPYGNSDFFCKLCSKELSNVYMHCDGCETLLKKDFNICVECHAEGTFQATIQMHPLNDKRHSMVNHTGNFSKDRQDRCPCKNGPRCRLCHYCCGCSCKCHQRFTLHQRFFTTEDEEGLVERVVAIVGDDEVPFADEVKERLARAAASTSLKAARKVPVRAAEDRKPSTATTTKQKGKRRASSASSSNRNPKKRRKVPESGGIGGIAKKNEKSRHQGRKRKLNVTKRAGESLPPAPEQLKTTSRRRRDDLDQVAPPEYAPKIRKSCHVFASSIVDVSHRPDELLPLTCTPSRPVSQIDLSDAALSFTEPVGCFLPMKRGSCIEGFERGGHEDLIKFINEARGLDVRTPSALVGLLPHGCKLSENDAVHLFRNYADTKDIQGNVVVELKKSRVVFSLREMEIMLYGHLKGLGATECCKLMPYRCPKNVDTIHRILKGWTSLLEDCEDYKKHLEDCVGLLFRLESGELADVTSNVVDGEPSKQDVGGMVGAETGPNDVNADESQGDMDPSESGASRETSTPHGALDPSKSEAFQDLSKPPAISNPSESPAVEM